MLGNVSKVFFARVFGINSRRRYSTASATSSSSALSSMRLSFELAKNAARRLRLHDDKSRRHDASDQVPRYLDCAAQLEAETACED